MKAEQHLDIVAAPRTERDANHLEGFRLLMGSIDRDSCQLVDVQKSMASTAAIPVPPVDCESPYRPVHKGGPEG